MMDKTNSVSCVISRSNELLSCCKTALKIAKRQQSSSQTDDTAAGWWSSIEVTDLRLYPVQYQTQVKPVLEEGLDVLRTMESELKHLEGLVRRRGQTNDPTAEIAKAVQRLERDTQELSALLETMVPHNARGQSKRHFESLKGWFQEHAQRQGERLQSILKTRAKVLEEQAQRRKQFQSTGAFNTKSLATSNPLFQIPKQQSSPQPAAMSQANGSRSQSYPTAGPASPPRASNSSHDQSPGLQQSSSISSNGVTSSSNSRVFNGGGGYSLQSPSYYGGGGYGGGYGANGGVSLGMRQRRTAVVQPQPANQFHQTEAEQIRQQVQIRQQQRQSQQRLEEAQQAEKSLAETVTLFAKMSNLISQQSETVSKIEDDIESAMMDVSAGQNEITTLYSIKKGNRALILKVFGLLIFFILFMRLYKK